MTVITALLGIGCATMGGVYFAFSFFVMEALAVLPDENGLRAMQSINRVILSSAFMPLFVGTTLGCIAVSGWTVYGWTLGEVDGPRDAALAPLLIASLVYLVGMFLCTAAFNVPLNNRLAAVNAGADDFWPAYVVQWTRWNHVPRSRLLSPRASSSPRIFASPARTTELPAKGMTPPSSSFPSPRPCKSTSCSLG